jgi:hypothetical protein
MNKRGKGGGVVVVKGRKEEERGDRLEGWE